MVGVEVLLEVVLGVVLGVAEGMFRSAVISSLSQRTSRSAESRPCRSRAAV
jgi:hypothetical protein